MSRKLRRFRSRLGLFILNCIIKRKETFAVVTSTGRVNVALNLPWRRVLISRNDPVIRVTRVRDRPTMFSFSRPRTIGVKRPAKKLLQSQWATLDAPVRVYRRGIEPKAERDDGAADFTANIKYRKRLCI